MFFRKLANDTSEPSDDPKSQTWLAQELKLDDVATPAGLTGYNLANGGPVMAWGVEGFVVSFIAPHSLTARALVVAPGDRLSIHNRSHEPLDIAVDGRPSGEIPAGGAVDARFVDAIGTIAQLPDSSFYRRLREKFGRLAS